LEFFVEGAALKIAGEFLGDQLVKAAVGEMSHMGSSLIVSRKSRTILNGISGLVFMLGFVLGRTFFFSQSQNYRITTEIPCSLRRRWPRKIPRGG